MPADALSLRRIAATTAACAALLALGGLWRAHVLQVRSADALTATTAAGQTGAPVARAAPPAPRPWRHRTAHFTIESTAGEAETAEVGRAAEALHAAWRRFFAAELAARALPAPQAPATGSAALEQRTGTTEAPLRLRLYAGQAEFKAHNRSRPWAEAYYLRPVSHAYVARGRGNRHHWMVHELVHQLNTELLERRHPRWIEEGLACYFGTSRMTDGALRPGEIDARTYPAWWLADFALGDDAARDVRGLRMIPLRAMLTGRDVPPLDGNVNLHYVQHWTLVHYLLQGDGGRHAAGFRKLMGTRAGLEEFERLIGPVDAIEPRWRAHRATMLAQMRAAASDNMPRARRFRPANTTRTPCARRGRASPRGRASGRHRTPAAGTGGRRPTAADP